MSYNLFIDDIRNPDWHECAWSGVDASLEWVIARSSKEACDIVKQRGMPARMALDHDLGERWDPKDRIDTVPRFLNWLAYDYFEAGMTIPEYTIHSANPVGAENMRSFMESWKRSVQ